MPYKDPEKRKANARERARRQRIEHPEKAKRQDRERQRRWVAKHPEIAKARNRRSQDKAKGTLRFRWNGGKHAAKQRNIEWNLSFEEYYEIASQPCFYCNNELGLPPIKSSGLDRLDNLKGYVIGNVVSCCRCCNMIRGDNLTVEETTIAVLAIINYRNMKAELAGESEGEMSNRKYAVQILADKGAVTIRAQGNSMQPLITTGDSLHLKKVEPSKLRIKDAVFVRVNSNLQVHYIGAIDQESNRFKIENARGLVNGWVGANSIFGLCVQVNDRIVVSEAELEKR